MCVYMFNSDWLFLQNSQHTYEHTVNVVLHQLINLNFPSISFIFIFFLKTVPHFLSPGANSSRRCTFLFLSLSSLNLTVVEAQRCKSLCSFSMMALKILNLSIWVSLILNFARGFDPVDKYYINCGSSTDFSVGSFTYVSDKSSSRFLSTPKDILAYTDLNSIPPSEDSALFQTARIFSEPSRYTFPINQNGRHWIRLHFYPFSFRNFHMESANFSVFAQKTTLLGNFTHKNATLKEYSVNVTGAKLVITFSPNSDSFAYINALEVVSVPDNLITDDASLYNPWGPFTGLVNRALETVARVNMGGPMVSLRNDTLGRAWVSDTGFLLQPNVAISKSNIPPVRYPPGGATSDTAPQTVYGTCTKMNSDGDPNSNFNVTWVFGVDQGFQYLIRLHFCDIVSSAANQLVFNVYIGTFVVAPDLELSSKSFGRLSTAYFMDFVTPLMDRNNFTVSIGPSFRSSYPDALLNGLEIMKISNEDRLSGVSTFPPFSRSKKKVGMIVGVSLGLLVAVIVMGILVLVRRRRKKQERIRDSKIWVPISVHDATSASKISNLSVDSNMSYRIPFVALVEATNNFDESRVIGIGGFGKVYKGVLSDGTYLAVKRGNPKSQQGLAEFRTEIEMLSCFRHRHLVSLIGYCDDNNEMILVYEYMENGTLKSHLYGSNHPSLGWKERLEICIGAARGLHYLHTGYAKAVIHRDVKSANILLDSNLMAKVADFGLSKTGPDLDQTHVSTAVKGSFGYLDPEYFRTQRLTEKSDVYSFGVVLLEVLCARPVIDPSLPREMVNLAEWAMKWETKGQLEKIIDPYLAGKIRPDSLRKFGETAEKCLGEFGVDRPSIGDVLWNLEYALQLQEAVVQDDDDEEKSSNVIDWSNSVKGLSEEEDDDVLDVSVSKVFSQLVKSEGR